MLSVSIAFQMHLLRFAIKPGRNRVRIQFDHHSVEQPYVLNDADGWVSLHAASGKTILSCCESGAAICLLLQCRGHLQQSTAPHCFCIINCVAVRILKAFHADTRARPRKKKQQAKTVPPTLPESVSSFWASVKAHCQQREETFTGKYFSGF